MLCYIILYYIMLAPLSDLPSAEVERTAWGSVEAPPTNFSAKIDRHRLNGYLGQGVPSLFLASSSRIVSNHAVSTCMFPWRARYPLS